MLCCMIMIIMITGIIVIIVIITIIIKWTYLTDDTDDTGGGEACVVTYSKSTAYLQAQYVVGTRNREIHMQAEMWP